MKHVRFNIFRKAAFAGAFLPYNIYINGEFVGTIKNGKTLNVDVPEADIYYLEDTDYAKSPYGTLCIYDYIQPKESAKLASRDLKALRAYRED